MLQARYDHDVGLLERSLASALLTRERAESRVLWSEACFGSFDGMTSVAGVVFALLAKPMSTIVLAAIGLAVASAVGMAAGEWLGDETASLRKALVMGLATAVGTLVPIVPFFYSSSKLDALIQAGCLAVVMTSLIGRVRCGDTSSWKPYLQSYAILAAAVVATVLVSLAIPASA